MLKAVVFDFGQTLINYAYDSSRDLWAFFRRATHLAYDRARQFGVEQPDWVTFMRALRRRLIWALARGWILDRDFDGRDLIAGTYRRFGVQLTQEQQDELAAAFYRPACELASPEPQLADVLRHIHALQLKIGLVSNTFIPGFLLERHLAAEGVLDLFDTRLYSSHTRVRKPDARIFNMCLERMGVAAHETMFVGDTFKTDVVGSKNLGMVCVMKNPDPLPRRGPRPDYQITRLVELIPILDRLVGTQPAATPS